MLGSSVDSGDRVRRNGLDQLVAVVNVDQLAAAAR